MLRADPNREKLFAVTLDNLVYRECVRIANDILNGAPDNTFNSTHYCTIEVRDQTKWARGKIPAAEYGNHLFFNNVPW
jgi:hypothetical protein